MKATLVLGLALAVVLATPGCGKADKSPPPPEFNGVSVDIPKLVESFGDASDDLKRTANNVALSVRYTKYEDALMSLDKLVNDPKVTAEQKKMVNQVIEQVKKLAGSTTAPAQ